MDNNFYKILETFKKLNESTFQESAMSEADQLITDLVNGDADVYDVYAHPKTPIEAYVSKIIHKYYEDVVIDTGMHADDDVESILDRVLDHMKHDYQVKEGSMTSAEHHPSGAKFGGYWKGADQNPPRSGQGVGGMEECTEPMSLEDQLRARWAETKRAKGLDEAGANNPAQATGAVAGGTPATPGAVDPKELANTQQNLNKLKSAGVPIPNVNQAAKSVMKDPNNPATPMSAQDKQVNQNLGLAMKNLLDKGNPSQVGQLSNIIKQAQQGQ